MADDARTLSSETERRLFDAALEVFAVKGRDGATMQEIADRAEINRPLLHYYFRGKDALYEAVIHHVFGQFMDSFGDALASAPTFAETLEAYIEGVVGYMSRHRHVVGLVVNENLDGGSIFGRLLREAIESPEPTPPRVMVEKIREAIERGEIRAVHPRHTMLSIVSLCLFFFVVLPTVRILEPTAEEDFEAFLDTRKDHLFDLVYRGLATREGAS